MRKIQFQNIQKRSMLFLCIVSLLGGVAGLSACASKKTNPSNAASAQNTGPTSIVQKLTAAGIPYEGDERDLILKITADAAFLKGKAAPTEMCNQQITILAGILNQYPDVKVKVEGHTDSKGSAAKNLKLSEARAEAIKGILMKNGIAATRIEALGYGATRPTQSNKTAAGREENRRMEIHLLSRS